MPSNTITNKVIDLKRFSFIPVLLFLHLRTRCARVGILTVTNDGHCSSHYSDTAIRQKKLGHIRLGPLAALNLSEDQSCSDHQRSVNDQ